MSCLCGAVVCGSECPVRRAPRTALAAVKPDVSLSVSGDELQL